MHTLFNAPHLFQAAVTDAVARTAAHVTAVVNRTASQAAVYGRELAITAAKILAAFAIVVLSLFVMVTAASVSATSFALLVRTYALWGAPSDADIPLSFDFSHRAQRCRSREKTASSCAIADAILDVRYATVPAAETYWGYEVAFTEPAFLFVGGARYKLTLEMSVIPDEAACHGMMTVQTQLFINSEKNESKILPTVFTTASSAAVPPLHSIAEEFWLTRTARSLFWLPIAVFSPHFGEPMKQLQPVRFELMSRFAPPKSVANSIRYFNFSLFSQAAEKESSCCSSSASSPTSLTSSDSSPSSVQKPSSAATACLRIYNPVLQIRVELTGLLARLHQNYPFTTFALAFGPAWLVSFAGTGAILFAAVGYLLGMF